MTGSMIDIQFDDVHSAHAIVIEYELASGS